MYYYNNNGKLQTSPIPIKDKTSIFLTPEQVKFCKGFDTKGIPIFDDSDFRKSILISKVNEINKNVETKILNDFYSSATGNKIHYQTSLTDQFEISQIHLANIDFQIKVYDENGESKRVFHTASQIAQIYNEFFQFLALIKIKGDEKKLYIRSNYLSINIEDLQNYNTEINIEVT